MYPYLLVQELWFNRMRRKIFESCRKDLAGKPCLTDEVSSRLSLMYADLNAHDSFYLIWIAHNYDIEPPDENDQTMWEQHADGRVLTPKGRNYLRKLIDDEKTRRFAVRVRWLKLLAPIVTALAALAGAATGLVLALKK